MPPPAARPRRREAIVFDCPLTPMKNTPLQLLVTTKVGTPRRGVPGRIADKGRLGQGVPPWTVLTCPLYSVITNHCWPLNRAPATTAPPGRKTSRSKTARWVGAGAMRLVSDYGYCTNFNIINNEIGFCGNYGLDAQNAGPVLVSNNYIHDCGLIHLAGPRRPRQHQRRQSRKTTFSTSTPPPSPTTTLTIASSPSTASPTACSPKRTWESLLRRFFWIRLGG